MRAASRYPQTRAGESLWSALMLSGRGWVGFAASGGLGIGAGDLRILNFINAFDRRAVIDQKN